MQTELFDLPMPRTLSEETPASKPSCLEKTFITLRLDQTIGLVLVLLVVYVLSFSWGVEKGKKSWEGQGVRPFSAEVVRSASPAAVASVSKVPLSAVVQETPAPSVPVPAAVSEPAKPVVKAVKPEGKFTIQHVTYITQAAADREIQKLAQKGYKSFVIPSGKHLQVCIEAFSTRQDASKILKQLKTQGLTSGDAYVRPMVR